MRCRIASNPDGSPHGQALAQALTLSNAPCCLSSALEGFRGCRDHRVSLSATGDTGAPLPATFESAKGKRVEFMLIWPCQCPRPCHLMKLSSSVECMCVSGMSADAQPSNHGLGCTHVATAYGNVACTRCVELHSKVAPMMRTRPTSQSLAD